MIENTTSNTKYDYCGYTHIWVPGCLLPLWKWLFCSRGIHLWDEVLTYSKGWEHYLVCDACQLKVKIDDRMLPEEN